MAKISNDKYYTPPELAERLIEKTFDVLEENGCEVTDIIEPSAGSGSFSDQMICTAYDICPEEKNIIKADFLQEPIEYRKGRLCIGNPPFGYSNWGSIRFFKKCIDIADYIAFVQPISQLNNNLQMYEFDLIYSEDLGIVDYSDVKLRCCFNIYRRPATGKPNPKQDYSLKDITLIELRRGDPPKEIPQEYDYSFCNWGNGTLGKPPQYIGQYAQEMYVYVHDKQYLPAVLNLLSEDKLRKYVKSISMLKISKMRLYKYLKDNIEGIE